MSSYSIDFRHEDGERGPYSTPAEVAAALEEYRRDHPKDTEFSRVRVWEMSPHGTAAGERSVWDFIERA